MQIENAISSERTIIRDYFHTDLPFVTSMWFHKENGKYLISKNLFRRKNENNILFL